MRLLSAVALLAPVVLLVAGGCGSDVDTPETAHADAGSSPDSGAPDGSDASDGGGGRVPLQHRPDAAACALPPPAGTCDEATVNNAATDPCNADSDCTAGTNGRCLHPSGGVAPTGTGCSCTYDTCATDTDCAGGQTCACHGAPYSDSVDNSCVPGNCRVDADCGTNGYCSPTSGNAECGDSLAGYYCHTASDQCVDDADCPTDPERGGVPRCLYSVGAGRWTCAAIPVCA